MGFGGCEPRIEGIVQCTKRYCTILRKLKKCVCVGGGGGGGGRGRAIFELKTLSMYLKKRTEKVKKKIIFTRKSSYCTLQADKSFEPLPIILSEVSHYFPRYHICKIAEYKIQKRAITQKE